MIVSAFIFAGAVIIQTNDKEFRDVIKCKHFVEPEK